MKRWALLITFALLFGVLTTLGSAWALAIWSVGVKFSPFTDHVKNNWSAMRVESMPDEPEAIHILHITGGEVRYASCRTVRSLLNGSWTYWDGERWRPFAGKPPVERRRFDYSWIILGWPFSAMEGGSLIEFGENGVQPQGEARFWSIGLNKPIRKPMQSSGLAEYERLLPLRPVLPGFALNTLLFGALWFGLFFAAGHTRRFIRTRRGRCPRCGYDLQNNLADGCSECGWGRGE